MEFVNEMVSSFFFSPVVRLCSTVRTLHVSHATFNHRSHNEPSIIFIRPKSTFSSVIGLHEFFMSTPRAERSKKHVLSFFGKNKGNKLNERPGNRQ